MAGLNRFFFARHLDDDETLLLVVHKHWLLAAKALFWPTLLLLAIWIPLYYRPSAVLAYIIAGVSVAIVIWWLRRFLDYYLDAWLITDRGVIDLEWHGWFHRTSSRVLYSDMQGISYEVHGVFGTLFNFGEITLEKISTGTTISMPAVKSPRTVEMAVLEASEAYLHSKNLKDAKTVQGILAEYVAGTVQKQSAQTTLKAKKTA